MGSFSVEAEAMAVRWSEDALAEDMNMTIRYEKPVFHELLARLPYTLLDQSAQVTIHMSPIALRMEQSHITFLLKCLDLNINYEDGMK